MEAMLVGGDEEAEEASESESEEEGGDMDDFAMLEAMLDG